VPKKALGLALPMTMSPGSGAISSTISLPSRRLAVEGALGWLGFLSEGAPSFWRSGRSLARV
jgi:hypothetical protein